MKKFILVIMFGLLHFGVAQAQQIQWYKATEISYKYIYNGKWTNWSDWEKVNINIKMDITNDIVVIYTNEPQVYKIIKQLPSPYDSTGSQIKFQMIDQDADIGNIRLRVENNGNSQIYIDFADISWVYNVRRIR